MNALTGKSGEARKIIARIEPSSIGIFEGSYTPKQSKRKYFPPLGVAPVYAVLGEADKAFEWLEKAYHEQTGSLALIKVSPDYDALRNDSRYADLLRRMRL